MSRPHTNSGTKEHSPLRKRFKKSVFSISRADLNSAFLVGVKQALAKQGAKQFSHCCSQSTEEQPQAKLNNWRKTLSDFNQGAILHRQQPDSDQYTAMRIKINELLLTVADMEA